MEKILIFCKTTILCTFFQFKKCVEVSNKPISDFPLSQSFQLAVITELGSPTDPNGANVARVKFTVRHAGQYRISVTVGGQHVAGSPFSTVFVAGPAFAQRTAVVRHCSTVVCTANVAHLLYIEPRDEYSNVCRYSSSDNPTEVS